MCAHADVMDAWYVHVDMVSTCVCVCVCTHVDMMREEH